MYKINDFDNPTNFITNSVPTVLSRCFKKNLVGLWISDENLESSMWRKRCTEDCEKNCTTHFEDIKKISLITKDGSEVSGGLIINPRICVVRQSKMIKLDANTRKFEGVWVKGDGEIIDPISKKKKYIYARKYVLIFLDKKNKRLHEFSIQLTARGVFSVEFGKKYEEFKTEFSKVYCSVTGTRSSRMKPEWYARCIFAPTFEMKMVGRPGSQNNACVVTSFENPTENNWEKLCTRLDPDLGEHIVSEYINYTDWYNRFSGIKRVQETESIPEDFDFE